METTTNNAVISGTVSSELIYSHEVYGEVFYNFYLECPRLSGAVDVLPVTISNRLSGGISQGDHVEIKGQIRSYNSYCDGKTKLILTLFAREITLCEKTENEKNEVELNGFICKNCVYRTTPFGRQIADILLAVNRNYSKSDYIPCICWGRNAVFTNSLDVGCNIKISGRMQSRIYQKKLSETEVIEKTAYEISVSKLEILNSVEKISYND